MDIAISASVLLVCSPVLIVALLAIKIESRGPAIFRQERLGLNGRIFIMYKLRGMYVDARELWPELYRYDLADSSEQPRQFHQRHDPRVTRVGRFLRATSLDEIPNLVNVLRGEMHLVGPRPEIPEMLHLYTGDAALVFSVKPGVTSLPKVSGRDQLTFDETIALDLDYLRRRSLSLDLRILAATVGTVVLQRGVLPGDPSSDSASASDTRYARHMSTPSPQKASANPQAAPRP